MNIYIASTGLRFALGVSGNSPLLVMGLNPSTATDTKFDLTLRKVSTIAHHAGFDGFVMLNLCPIRATAIHQLPHDLPTLLHRQNLETIHQIVERFALSPVWGAWGVGIQARSYLGNALRAIVNDLGIRNRWLHYDTLTKEGHPRHPSRAKYGAKFYPFLVRDYAENMDSTTAPEK